MIRLSLSILALTLLLTPLASSAANAGNCSNPVKSEGEIIYNTTSHVAQYCNGSNWIAFGKIDPAAGGGSCSNPTRPEGALFYNTAYHVLEFCNGSGWQAVGGTAKLVAPAGSGYFVLTKTTFSGSLGGLSGANAACLTDLTTNTGWWGYAQAQAAGQLTSSKVFAFLCDGSTCNSLQATTAYYFANSNDSSAGGASFITNASGNGPNDSTAWGQSDHFGGNVVGSITLSAPWSGRGTGSVTTWPATSAVDTCTNWTTNSGAVNGQAGIVGSQANSSRWSYPTVRACNNALPLICVVNP